MPKRKFVSKPYSQSKKRRVFKKSYKRRPGMRRQLVRIARSAILSRTETKYKSTSTENAQLYHNYGSSGGGGVFTPIILGNMLSTSVGNTQSTRLGDEVYPRILSIKLWLSNKSDRPNVMYRVFVVACPPDQATTGNPNGLFKGASGNKMIDYIDTDKYNVKYHRLIRPMSGDYSLESGATNKEHSTYLSIRLKLGGSLKYQADDGTLPKYQRYCLSLGVIPYDAYGTLTTDNIASCAVIYRFYYKDP